MDSAGVSAEWDDILRDLNALSETAITYNGKTFVVRSQGGFVLHGFLNPPNEITAGLDILPAL